MKAKTKTLASTRPRGQHSRVRPDAGLIRPYLFVYGTLKRGEKSHSELRKVRGVRYIADGRIRGRLYRIRGADFPGAVPTSLPNSYVTGQLFFMEHPKLTLATLDEFEGVNEGLFRRDLVEVQVNGKPLKAWTYFYARPVANSSLLPVGVYSPE